MQGVEFKLGSPGRILTEPVRWPRFAQVGTQIRQVTTAAQPAQVQNGLGSANVSTINQPKPVSILRVNTAIVNETVKRINVSFLQNSGDPNYQKVNVYLKIGKALPVLAASGTTSPIAVNVTRTTASATVLVQAEGNWGPHPLENSPSKSINLS
jgi:hypothetical protein